MESQGLYTNTQDFETYSNEPVCPVGRLESDGQYFQTLMDDAGISNGGEHFMNSNIDEQQLTEHQSMEL